jgi:hypothetical protein
LLHAAARGIVYVGRVKRRLVPFLVACIAGGLACAQNGLAQVASTPAKTPVIVELFTSEGCSSCPPADNLLARLPGAFRDIDVIPLSEHVDYWNNLGWKDRFSSTLFTMRQQDYGRALNLQNVYTPEMVVNGAAECLGSDQYSAQKEIRKAAEGPKAAASLAIAQPGVIHIMIDRIPPAVKNADVFLAITESNLESLPNRGENTGARLRHVGVVRNLTTLAHLDLKKSPNYVADAKLNLDPEWRRENLEYVVFVQDRLSRRIVGAATLHP